MRDPRSTHCPAGFELLTRRANGNGVWYTCNLCQLRVIYASKAGTSGARRSPGPMPANVDPRLINAHLPEANCAMLAVPGTPTRRAPSFPESSPPSSSVGSASTPGSDAEDGFPPGWNLVA